MKIFLLKDKHKSVLTKKEVTRYKSEITKISNNPVCPDLSTFDVSGLGIEQMKNNNQSLIKEQIDV